MLINLNVLFSSFISLFSTWFTDPNDPQQPAITWNIFLKNLLFIFELDILLSHLHAWDIHYISHLKFIYLIVTVIQIKKKTKKILHPYIPSLNHNSSGYARLKAGASNFFRVFHMSTSPETWAIFCYFQRRISRALGWMPYSWYCRL